MRKTILFFFLAVFSAALPAQELIRNGGFDDPSVSDCFLSQSGGHFLESGFVEDLTWNKCLKLELKAFQKDRVGAILVFGRSGDKRNKVGFEAKPNTTYEFSFELKGTVPGIVACALLFHNDDLWWKSNKRIKTSLGGIKVTKEWTKYRGTFRTETDTTRAALGIQLWADEKLVKRDSWHPGQFLLIDNVSVMERSAAFTAKQEPSGKITPVPVLFAPSKNNRFGDNIPFEIACDKDKITVTTTLPPSTTKKSVKENGRDVWADDVVEVFFGPPKKADRVLSQFVLASGGGRYMGNGQRELKNYDRWNGKVSGRNFSFEIPWKTIGFEPEPGQSIAFNIGAQFNGKAHCLPPLQRNFHDVKNYNLLIFGTLAEYLAKECPGAEKFAGRPPSEAVALMREMKQKARWAELGKSPFIAAVFPVTHGFSLPLEVTQKELVTGPIELTALVNEHKVLPFAIMNRTGKTDTYRIVVRDTNLREEIDRNGLDGGFTGITLREALAVKDSDAPDAGRIFDPLPKMNEAQTISVAPGETGLVWITFDCTRPGTFSGLIRVIPLGEPAVVARNRYTGKMRDFKLTLKVLPYALKPLKEHGVWAPSYLSENLFRVHQELAPSELMLSPWIFRFRFDEKGNVVNKLPELSSDIRSWYGLFKKYNSNPKLKIAIGYSVYGVMVRAHLNKKIKPDSPECFNAFKNYLLACAALMKEAGVPESEYAFELFDEPNGKNFERDLNVAKAAREALPNANFIMTWAPHNFGYTPDMIRKFIPFVNYHLFHHLLLADPDFMKVIEEVKRTPDRHYGYYVCSTSMREPLHRYYRLIGWKGLRTGAEFYHIYTFCESPWGTPGATNWKAAAAGGLVLRGGDIAIPTIRYEAAREGFTDVRYLELLNDPEFSRKAVEEVVIKSPHDPFAPDKLRKEVIRRLNGK